MYWAKPDETYEEHINNCYEIWRKLIQHNEKHLIGFAESYGISYKLFREKSLLAVLFHDIGKLTDVFQENMLKIRSGNRPDYRKNFRHEILSAIFLLMTWGQRKQLGIDREFPFEVFAVIGHHKSIDPNWTSFHRELQLESWPKLNREKILYALDTAQQILTTEGIQIRLIDKFYDIQWNSSFLSKLRDMVFQTAKFKLESVSDSISYRQIYSVLKGILQYCDWQASAGNDGVWVSIPEGQEDLIKKVGAKLANEKKQYEERPFHNACMKEKGDVLAIAPTGSGKTEAALLWALNSNYRRIIFLMPTMITSNSLYERMVKNYFDLRLCGLTHSGAQTYFALQGNLTEEEDQELRLQLLHNKAFIPPLMVSTVDQLLSTGFNTGLWNLKEAAIVGSSIVFDEIHAYDTYTLALITETIKKIKKLNGRVMVMSATMPQVLRKHFMSILQVKEPIIAEERMQIARNKWRFVEKDLDDLEEEIEEYLDAKKRVAIIVNDIETAKREYRKWKNKNKYNLLCYHSEFALKDRREKEKRLMATKWDKYCQLLIATQAVEVSLDISFEIMFSECAPIDSLIQRAGRCNRYNEYKDSEFIIFDYSDLTKDKVYKKSREILEKTKEVVKRKEGRLSELDISNMLEEVYQNYNLYDEDYKAGEELYRKIAKDEIFYDIPISDEKTRKFDYIKVDIIPIQFKEEVENLFEQKQFSKIAQYEVPVGIGKYIKMMKNGRQVDNKYRLPIFNIGYSSETGIEMEELERSFTIL
jgi:CRISPR-associated endonuclease/helicase Cas3